MELNSHQDRGLVADRAGAVTLAAVRFDAALVLSERERARPLLDAGSVHAFDEPAAREDDDPLRRGVLMPLADPADRLDGEDHRGLRARLLIVPLRRRLPHLVQVVVGEAAFALATHSVGVDPKVPVRNAGLGPGL